MSRATTRTQIAAWFAPPAVAGLHAVYSSQPKLIPITAYRAGAPAGTASGAAMFVHIEQETEPRIAFGGSTSGKKAVRYEVGLVVRFMSVRPKAEDAMGDYDAVIDAMKARIRSDRQFGTAGGPNPLLEAGERGPGITLISDLPRQNKNGATLIWSVLKIQVQEIATT